MKLYFFLLLFVVSSFSCLGQQLPLFTQYREYHGVINPAAVSSDYFTYYHNFSAGISHRLQWADFEGSPQTSLVKGEYIIDTGGSVSLLTGAHILNDQTGPTGNTGVYGRIAGILTNGNYATDGGIVLGLNVGLSQFRIQASNIELIDPTDDLTKNSQSKIYPDVGAGLYFYNRFSGGGFLDDDNFYFGISVPQLFGLDLTFTNEFGDYTVTKVPHFFGLMGLYKYFGDESFFEPSIWIRYVEGAPVQIDGNIRVQWERLLWIGVGASNNGTVHVEGGFIMGGNSVGEQHFKLGLGYDHTFSTFGPFAGTTYEINLAYTFGNE